MFVYPEPYDVIVAMRERTRFPAQVLDALPNLKLLVSTGGRNPSIDAEACARRNIALCAAHGAPKRNVKPLRRDVRRKPQRSVRARLKNVCTRLRLAQPSSKPRASASRAGELGHDGAHTASRAVYESVLEATATGTRTPDLGGHASTSEFTGEVIDVDRISSTLGGDVVFKVTIELDDQPQGLLWGMSADVQIQTAE